MRFLDWVNVAYVVLGIVVWVMAWRNLREMRRRRAQDESPLVEAERQRVLADDPREVGREDS